LTQFRVWRGDGNDAVGGDGQEAVEIQRGGIQSERVKGLSHEFFEQGEAQHETAGGQ